MTSARTRTRMVERLRERGHPRRGRAGGDERGAAPHLRRRGARDPRLRRHAAADRPRADDLAAVGRRADDRARAQRRARSTRVLEIGTGCGYQTAVLAQLARRGLHGRAHRRAGGEGAAQPAVAQAARTCALKHGDGSADLGEELAVDAIVVTAGATHVPTALLRYLKPGGRMVLPLAQHGDGERRRAAAHRDRSDAGGLPGADARCGKIRAVAARDSRERSRRRPMSIRSMSRSTHDAVRAPSAASRRVAVARRLLLAGCAIAHAGAGRGSHRRAAAAAPPPPTARRAPPPRRRRREPTRGRRPTRSSAATRCYQIALDHGLDYRELAAWNNIENVNVIRVGQVLRLTAPGEPAPARRDRRARRRRCARRRRWRRRRRRRAAPCAGARRCAAPPGARNTDNYKTQPKAVKEPYSEQALRDVAARRAVAPPPRRSRRRPRAAPPASAATGRRRRRAASTQARAGARGRRRRQARLGVAGERQGRHRLLRNGEPEGHRHRGHVGAAGASRAPAGKVVYAGTGLRGYGKLIIIKHNETYLSAYAHNRDILVKEGQQVARGPEDRRDGQHRRRPGEAALRDPPAGQADGSAAIPAAAG